MKKSKSTFAGKIGILIFSVLIFLPVLIMGQTAEIPYHFEKYDFNTGFHSSDGKPGTSPVLVFTKTIQLGDVPWLRLHFSKVNLGQESFLIITSMLDGAQQKLDAKGMSQWQNSSAYFNGNTVELELWVAPGDANIYVGVDEIMVGEYAGLANTESICGPTDDRISSNNPKTGRLLNIGCTAWIIPNGKLVSAGHCLSSGAGLASTLEFNVPPSLPNGTIQHPGPEDQYATIGSSFQFTDGGIGNDWGVFEVSPNTITGLMPKEAQGDYWVLAQDLGPTNIRITGYGVDDGEDNQTQQTHVGPNAGSTGTTMRYQTDTQGGNSGSPVIDDATGRSVGVHTHGGCTSSGGNNSGTSLFHANFWAAVDMGQGGCDVEPASNPNPPHGASNVSINIAELTWDNGAGAISNELYFGTDPGSLALVQSGTLATSWTVAGPLVYNTTYYWRVDEIGDTCTTTGSVWSFTTEFDPNTEIVFQDPFDSFDWTPVGPSGLTNWSTQTSSSAGGTPPELQFSWTPSFVGQSYLLSPVITGYGGFDISIEFRHFVDWFADPLGPIGLAYTTDGGSTYTTIWEIQPTGNVGPEVAQTSFIAPNGDFQFAFYYNGNSFNIDFWYIDDFLATTVIPVELTSFTAQASENEVILNWITASETNNQGFDIERKTSGGVYEKVGFVAGHGTVTETKNYTFTDKSLLPGNYTYRLKQIDFGGNFEYSDEVEVEVTAPKVFELSQNYPNPFNPSTTIKFSLASDSKVTLKIFDVLGQEVAELLNGQITAGVHNVNFDAGNLNSGVYFYRIDAAGVDGTNFSSVKKMILTK
ncbi:MAG: hypothetical protein Kow0098_27840 [Ignavibacteriaceae bacterium]